MADAAIRCWRCGASLPDALFPLRREEVCPACNVDLHVCRQCAFYNPAVSDACNEPIAPEVTNKERANFCDYLKPSAVAFAGDAGQEDAAARAALEALFGDAPGAPASTDPERNRRQLERLFGLDEGD